MRDQLVDVTSWIAVVGDAVDFVFAVVEVFQQQPVIQPPLVDTQAQPQSVDVEKTLE